MPIPRASQALPEDDLQPRAIVILKAKNRLSAEDAKLVEEAFAGRMALQGARRMLWRRKNPGPPQSIQVHPNRPNGQGDVPER